MVKDQTDGNLTKKEILLPVRAVLAGWPMATAAVAFMWTTGYPVDEWVTVAVVFTVCVLITVKLVVGLTLFIAKRLDRYGRQVVSDLGIDLDMREPSSRTSALIVAAFVMLIIWGTAWGAAVQASALVVSRMGLPSLGAELSVATLIMLYVGIGGLALATGIPAAIFYTASHRSSKWVKVFILVVARSRDNPQRFALVKVVGL